MGPPHHQSHFPIHHTKMSIGLLFPPRRHNKIIEGWTAHKDAIEEDATNNKLLAVQSTIIYAFASREKPKPNKV